MKRQDTNDKEKARPRLSDKIAKKNTVKVKEPRQRKEKFQNTITKKEKQKTSVTVVFVQQPDVKLHNEAQHRLKLQQMDRKHNT